MQDNALTWRPMKGAPRDGTRVLVVVRGGEQGVAEIDVVRWSRPAHRTDDTWVSTDSSHDCCISYEEWEVVNWMPLPPTAPPVRTPALIAMLPDPSADNQEAGGSGI